MATPSSSEIGTLYIVATPIGNLEDITFRAIRTLKEADLIACEDTRHTRRLLDHYQISTPTISYYREKEKQRSALLLEKLLAGTNIALVSDAGTPAISDPGAVLVTSARKAGIRVVPIPGSSALTVSLSVAGLEYNEFIFLGFPSAKKNERRKHFKSLASLPHALIFYESPHRISSTVSDLLKELGERHCLFCRELTKIHEEIRETTLGELSRHLKKLRRVKGEIVLIVFAADETDQPDSGDLEELLRWYNEKGISLKQAVHNISRDLGLKRTPVYRQALEIWQTGQAEQTDS